MRMRVHAGRYDAPVECDCLYARANIGAGVITRIVIDENDLPANVVQRLLDFLVKRLNVPRFVQCWDDDG